MKQFRRPLFKREEIHPSRFNGIFSFMPILPQIIIIAIVAGIYYYLNTQELFPLWINYIYYAVKIIIALEIIIAAAKSLWGPLLAIALGALNLYLLQTQGMEIISYQDAWQLIIIGIIGFFITFIVRSLRRL